MKESFKRILPYIVSVFAGLLLFVIVICTQKIWAAQDMEEVMQILSDACFAPGVLFAGIGLLDVIRRDGIIMTLVHAAANIFYTFRRIFILLRRDRVSRAYYDAVREDKENSLGCLILVGIVFIVLAVIFLVGYYKNLTPIVNR